MKSRWKTLSGIAIPEILRFVEEASANGRPVHIGCDSLQYSRFTGYVVVVAILNPPHGGRVAYCRESVPRIKSLRERLVGEVWRSVSLALELQAVVKGELTIHVDANPNAQFKSNAYVRELTSMVVSQGFRLMLKPDAWAASHAADWGVRHLGKMTA